MTKDGSLERYSRQMRFHGIGEEGQRRLQQARVTLCGCGALGTVLANALVRAGVGHVRLIDRDFIEMSNLQRQVLFDEHDVPFSPIQNAEQVLADPQLAALRQMQEIPLGAEHEASIPRLPISLSLTPPSVAGPPPALGEHGRAILSEAGYSPAEIEQLACDGVCKLP